MQSTDQGSKPSRVANVVGAVVAVAGAVVASPAAVAALPKVVVHALSAAVTLGNTAQPLLVTVLGIMVTAVTHPPKWLKRW